MTTDVTNDQGEHAPDPGGTRSAAGGEAATSAAPIVAPAPDLRRLERAVAGERATAISTVILAVLAVFYALYVARAFAVPVAFALLLNLLLSPVIRALARLHVPPPVGTLLLLVALLALLGFGVSLLAEPAQQWVRRAPHTVANVEHKLRRLREPVEQVTRTAEQVQQAAQLPGTAPTREVVVRGPTLVSRLFGTTQSLLAGLVEVVFLLYFLLASGDLFMRKLVHVLPAATDQQIAVRIVRRIEASISTYLLTLATVSLSEGVVVAVALALLGMPNVILWGVLTALLELIPYLGAATMVAVLTLAGLATFDSVPHALLVPATFLVINLLQANIVSPALLGYRLTLNPVAIFIGLALWFFLWGVPGAFLAVPMLAAMKIVCDHIEPLASIGAFLGRREEPAEEGAT